MMLIFFHDLDERERHTVVGSGDYEWNSSYSTSSDKFSVHKIYVAERSRFEFRL